MCVIADVKTAHDAFSRGIGIHDTHDIHDTELLQIVGVCVIQHSPDRGIRASHEPFHAVYCTEEMGFVNHLNTTGTDKDVLKSVGDPDDLVWDYLSDGDDEFIVFLYKTAVHGNRNAVVEFASRNPLHKLGWHFTEVVESGPPAMDMVGCLRQVAIHLGDLRFGHWCMRADSGQDIKCSAIASVP